MRHKTLFGCWEKWGIKTRESFYFLCKLTVMRSFGKKSAMQFECLILGRSDKQRERVPDRRATTWSKNAKSIRKKVIQVGDYGVLGNIYINYFVGLSFDHKHSQKKKKKKGFDHKNCHAKMYVTSSKQDHI